MKIVAPRAVLSLRYVERIMVRFDPFHERARSVRCVPGPAFFDS
jgi:hypothetical protein